MDEFLPGILQLLLGSVLSGKVSDDEERYTEIQACNRNIKIVGEKNIYMYIYIMNIFIYMFIKKDIVHSSKIDCIQAVA